MKTIIKIQIAIFMIILGSCQEIKSQKSIVKVEVKDETGNLVSNADILGSNEELIKNSPVLQSKYVSISVKTDQTGKAILNHSTYSGLPDGVLIQKEGYYNTKHSITWSLADRSKTPPTVEISAVLKKIRNPIHMHVVNFTLASKEIEIYELNKTYDYDLQVNDFLPPQGNGVYSDIKLLVTGKNDMLGNANIELAVKVSDKEGGFAPFYIEDSDSGSYFKSDYLAVNDGYVNEINFYYNSQDSVSYMNQDKKINYYFKVRPITNSLTGKKEWHYGKIYGPLSLWARRKESSKYTAGLQLNSVYFNPTLNDRNVECDTSRNLSPKRDEYNQLIKIFHP